MYVYIVALRAIINYRGTFDYLEKLNFQLYLCVTKDVFWGGWGGCCYKYKANIVLYISFVLYIHYLY